MNVRAVLLPGSLALNAVLVAAFIQRPALAPPPLRDLFSREPAGAAALASDLPAQRAKDAERTAAATAARAKRSQAMLWSALASEDLPTLVARLRAAGFPPAIIRAIVSAQVDRRFQARMKALASTVEDTPFWQPSPAYSFRNPKFSEERQQIYRDRARAMRELLGDDALAAAGADPTAAQRSQFGNLSKAKIDLVQRIADDYAEMISQVRAATQGITLPEDRAKFALLEREKRADLAALLTPQELEDYEMRSSPVTSRLRSAMTLMNATEEEFRSIFRAQQPHAEILHPTSSSGFNTEIRRSREDALKQVAAQLTSALGEARYAEFARAQHHEFQQLARLAQRENLPQTAAVRAFELRDTTSQESVRISEDKSLSVDQKRAAMQALAKNTRTQLAVALGPNAGASYAQSAPWLQAIEKGSVVTFNGTTTNFRSITTPPSPAQGPAGATTRPPAPTPGTATPTSPPR